MALIDRFVGCYRFLSNFWACSITYEGFEYPSVEHAYQAAKTELLSERLKIQEARSPGVVKRLGKQVTIRSDWNDLKYGIMLYLVREKFKNPKLRRLLEATGDEALIEGNTWGDTYWGVCNGEGQNNLGKILMRVRQENKERAEVV